MTNDRHLHPTDADRNTPSASDNTPIDLDRRRPDRNAIEIGALIDSELSRAARERVEARLLTDTDSRRDYEQLARLSHALRSMPAPKRTISPEELANRTIAAARDRKRHQRRSVASWGGTAIAALFVATMSLSGSLRLNREAPSVSHNPTPVRDASLNSSTEVTDAEPTADESESPLLSRALFVE